MPDTNEGPAGTVEETAAATPDAGPMPGFAEAMTLGHPNLPQGEPEGESAVEANAAPEATEAVKAETPAKEPAKAEANPEPTKAVNFDGFSDESKAYWENALKAGHATQKDVERARIESLFQQSYTRKTMDLAEKAKKLNAESEARKGDLEILDKIRNDERLYQAWLKMSRGDVEAADATDTDFVDARKAAEIAEKKANDAYDRREREKAERSKKEQEAYDVRFNAHRAAIQDAMKVLGVDGKTMLGYVKAEEVDLNGADPTIRYEPHELVKNVLLRHKAAVAEAEAAALREQLNQRASKQVQASKQSLPPPRRVANEVPDDPMSKTMRDLGITDWAQVSGLGFHNPT